MTLVDFPPYSSESLITQTLKACCGNCVKATILNTLQNISELDFNSFQQSDLIYPILGNSFKSTMYGYYFMPICPVPDFVYVTRKLPSVFRRLIEGIQGAYPLVVICLLMTILSGFFIWLIEMWLNEEEFSRCLFHGWFDGIWWSFISMTTVGYGDKLPRTVLGRIYAVIWILLGITMFGLLTGLLTNAIMNVDKPADKELRNAKVGVLKFRLHDATLVEMEDGIVVESDGVNFYDDLISLLSKLRAEKVDGFILDKLTYWTVISEIIPYFKKNNYTIKQSSKDSNVIKENSRFFLNNVTTAVKKYKGEKQSYGVLTRNKAVYTYFRDVMADNSFVIQTGLKELVKDAGARQAGDSHEDLISFTSETFKMSVAVMGGMTMAMSMIGLVFTIFRNRQFKHSVSVSR